MKKKFTLEYWIDEGWFVGRLKEIPGIFSQGETIQELKDNINDVYHLMREDNANSLIPFKTKFLELEIIHQFKLILQ